MSMHLKTGFDSVGQDWGIMTLICAWRWGAWSQDWSLLFLDISFDIFFYKEKKRTDLLEPSLPNVRHMWQPQLLFPWPTVLYFRICMSSVHLPPLLLTGDWIDPTCSLVSLLLLYHHLAFVILLKIPKNQHRNLMLGCLGHSWNQYGLRNSLGLGDQKGLPNMIIWAPFPLRPPIMKIHGLELGLQRAWVMF